MFHRHFSSLAARGPEAILALKIASKELRDDLSQRRAIAAFQSLYERLLDYHGPPVAPVELADGKKKEHRVGLEKMDDEANVFSTLARLFHRHRHRIKSNTANSGETVLTGSSMSAFSRNSSKEVGLSAPKGLYCYGDVGSGKTMLMDLFFSSLTATERKRRVHFHAFMQDVHRKVHNLRRLKGSHGFDPIPPIAQELANEAYLLCFDEMQVTDITDAMLLRRLFTELFKRGVVVVTTSNRPPDELYKNGIQRSSFLPTIDLFKQRCVVYSLESETDHRTKGESFRKVFFSPLNAHSNESVDRIWESLAKGKPVRPRALHFLGRTLTLKKTVDRFARVTFGEICGQPLSAADYLEIVKNFDLIMLTDVPRMTLAQRNEARRFITLLDALYDNRVKLVMNSEVGVRDLLTGESSETTSSGSLSTADRMLMDDLKLSTDHMESSIFTGAEEIFAFRRAVSRLIEMQSEVWWSTFPHKI